MWYAYILQSVDHPDQQYTGATSNLRQRLADHNAGKSPPTHGLLDEMLQVSIVRVLFSSVSA